ncbi:hypothetical protein BO79DRAFT_258547 [Aspergillus costaricaensis CBS 115574]|uniref:Uncharacterized protein n=1 Tax=Aspergillus costaricaensis CBS 115574 TaxID=1448317 RepID=A0ACD1I5K3_9EURO|nr:hypothetical protein BO79DRAFT_258547 [Aspergillus costaricaensis CBS 115574]RAK85268.1 hypothetical protein BO79DRAFT_258547 [Aspergillus costaricaensis CBS 115574]
MNVVLRGLEIQSLNLTFVVHNGEYPSAVALKNNIVSKRWTDKESPLTATDHEENTVEASHYTDEDYTNVNCLQKQLSEVQAVVRAEQKIFRLDTQRLTHDNYMLIAILQSEYIKKPHKIELKRKSKKYDPSETYWRIVCINMALHLAKRKEAPVDPVMRPSDL